MLSTMRLQPVQGQDGAGRPPRGACHDPGPCSATRRGWWGATGCALLRSGPDLAAGFRLSRGTGGCGAACQGRGWCQPRQGPRSSGQHPTSAALAQGRGLLCCRARGSARSQNHGRSKGFGYCTQACWSARGYARENDEQDPAGESLVDEQRGRSPRPHPSSQRLSLRSGGSTRDPLSGISRAVPALQAECLTAIPGNRHEPHVQRMSGRTQSGGVSVLSHLTALSEMSFSWLLSLMVRFSRCKQHL